MRTKALAGFASAGIAFIAWQALAASTAGITMTPEAAVADQLIECTTSEGPGISTAEFFLVKDGSVKRYSRSMNAARGMCPQGAPDCALGWRDGNIELYFRLPSGESLASTISLETLTIEKRMIDAAGGESSVAGTCTTAPIPAGVTID